MMIPYIRDRTNSGLDHFVPENVAFMRLPICCLEIICVRSLPQFVATEMPHKRKRRVKKHKELKDMLERVLTERVISGTVVDKFKELCELKHSPVYFFLTRKACRDFNSEMLNALDSIIHQLACVDEIDETTGSQKWDKTAAKNSRC